ncbi:hypothetical protein [Paenibacillus sp. 32O-W]|uniref:hypothetical protein n=1 Tax=Paenibacillus sp. 32O-W TaxID=1695218 RepID=UPI0011A5E8FC|nr:hypothetical protein [Paenibacillus sp. 32O-W]
MNLLDRLRAARKPWVAFTIFWYHHIPLLLQTTCCPAQAMPISTNHPAYSRINFQMKLNRLSVSGDTRHHLFVRHRLNKKEWLAILCTIPRRRQERSSGFTEYVGTSAKTSQRRAKIH